MRQRDHAQFDQRAVETAFPFRRRREIGFAALLEQGRAGGKNLVKRQTRLLQGDGPKKSNIQVRAASGNQVDPDQ